MRTSQQRAPLMRRRCAAGALGTVAVLLLAACSSSGSDASQKGLPATINITALEDLTGAVGGPGLLTKNGMELAAEQINSSHFLGNSTLSLSFVDTASTVPTAISAMSKVIASSSVAMLAPVLSTEGVAIAPEAQHAKLPYIATQEGSPGIVTAGDYIFRVTTPAANLTPLVVDYLGSHNIKSVAIIYDQSAPTDSNLANTVYPSLLKAANIKLTDTESYQTGSVDFSAQLRKMIATHPGAIGYIGPASFASPIVSQTRSNGFTGQMFGDVATGGTALQAAGTAGKGNVWPTDFIAGGLTDPSSVAFTKAYEAKYNQVPANYAAEGYDAVELLARGLKDAPDYSRAGVQAGLIKATDAGFDGALGQLTFQNRDLVVKGLLGQWDGTKDVPVDVSAGSSS
jgi:branched-chain amino acid transport system substrate-binding protein